MSIHPRIHSALAAVRKANGVASTMQLNEFIMSADQVATSVSSIRIDLSCAAADLATIIDEAEGGPSLKPLRLAPAKGGQS